VSVVPPPRSVPIAAVATPDARGPISETEPAARPPLPNHGGHGGQQPPGGERRRRHWLRWLLALALAAPVVKVYVALAPMLDHDLPVKDEKVLEALTAIARREAITSSWGWLVSQASDRLIRDVYAALVIVADYTRNGPRSDNWSDIHQRGADTLLKLCQVGHVITEGGEGGGAV